MFTRIIQSFSFDNYELGFDFVYDALSTRAQFLAPTAQYSE